MFDDSDAVWPFDERITVRRVREKAKVPEAVSKVVSRPTSGDQPFALAAPIKRQRRQQIAAVPVGVEFMSAAELVDWLGLSRSTIHRLKACGDFPQPIQISRRRVAYRVSEVREWLEHRERKGAADDRREPQRMRA